MPTWLKNQLLRAFRDGDRRSVIMLNRVYYKYRRNAQMAETP